MPSVRCAVAVVAVVAWSAGALAQTQTAPPRAPASAVAPGGGYEQLLAEAREAGRHANALAGPRLPPTATRADSNRAATDEFAKWLDERGGRVNRAKAAYAAATPAASGLQRAVLQREISEVLLAFFDELYATMRSLMAPAIVNKAGHDAVRRIVLGKFMDMFENVHKDLTDCVRVTGAPGGDAAENHRCAAQLARVNGLFAEADAAVAEDEWRYLYVETGDHKSPPERRTKDCGVGGNLSLSSANVYPTADAKQASFNFHDVDVALLAPGPSRAGRLQVRAEWPLVAEGWINAERLPFSLRKRVDIVKGKLWLGAGARVSAYGARDGRVTIVRPGAPPGAPRPQPDGAEIEVGCDALGLPQYKLSGTPEKGKPGALSGTFQLFDTPNGKPIATLHAPANDRIYFVVRVLGEKAGFTRVLKWGSDTHLDNSPYLPFDFDGWVKGPVPPNEPLGGLFGGEAAGPPTHRATSQAALRAEPNSGAPVVARIAKGAPFVTGRAANGFITVKLPGVSGEPLLWLAQADLAATATALPRPANAPPPPTARERRRRLTDIPVYTFPPTAQ